jgi:hypothetical protein
MLLGILGMENMLPGTPQKRAGSRGHVVCKSECFLSSNDVLPSPVIQGKQRDCLRFAHAAKSILQRLRHRRSGAS